MEIKVSTRTEQVPVTVIYVNGDIDSTTSQDFRSKIEGLISNLAFVSSAGLRALHNDVDDDNLRKNMSIGTYKSPYLKVANPSPKVKEVFELGGFDTYIEIHHDINKAVNSF